MESLPSDHDWLFDGKELTTIPRHVAPADAAKPGDYVRTTWNRWMLCVEPREFKHNIQPEELPPLVRMHLLLLVISP